jgi:YD repeat-containing protein
MTVSNLESASTQLRADAQTSHGDLSRFIADLSKATHDTGIKTPELNVAATKILSQQGILPNFDVAGISADGKSMIMTDATKKQYQVGADEKISEIKPDPAFDNGNNIQRDDKGRVKSEPGAKIEYDQNGDVKSITVPPTTFDNGPVKIEKQKDGTWTDKDTPLIGPPRIDQKTGDVTTTDTQGFETVRHANGSEVMRDKDGRVVYSNDSKGHTTSIMRDKSGNLTSVDIYHDDPKHKDGLITDVSLSKQPDGTWKDKVSGQTFKDVGFNKDGELYAVDQKGNTTTYRLDGTKDTVDSTGAKVQNTSDKQPMTEHQKWLKDRAQARIDSEKDINDQDSHTVKHGDTMWDIARASCKAHGDKYPSAKTINAEVARLAKNNGITDPEKVPIGKKIDTSVDEN